MNNYFIAIRIPENVSRTVFGLVKKYRGIRISFVNEELYHFTLKFLGRVREEDAIRVFDGFIFKSKKFTASGYGFFYYGNKSKNKKREGRKSPGNGENKKAGDERNDDDKKIPRVFFIEYLDESNNHYHLTIARIKNPGEGIKLSKLAGKEKFENDFIKRISFEASEVLLLKSQVDEKGKTSYSEIKRRNINP